jgi:hypothetical protein
VAFARVPFARLFSPVAVAARPVAVAFKLVAVAKSPVAFARGPHAMVEMPVSCGEAAEGRSRRHGGAVRVADARPRNRARSLLIMSPALQTNGTGFPHRDRRADAPSAAARLLGQSALQLIKNQFAMLLERAEACLKCMEHRVHHLGALTRVERVLDP